MTRTAAATATPTAAQRNRLAFTVYGLPAPQGSKRYVGKGRMIESSKAVKPWRAAVHQAALDAMGAAPWWHPDDHTRVLLHVTFTLPRPRFHYRAGRFAHLLHDRAPAWPATRPDLDKLLRSTGDALTTAGAYTDDSRVCQVIATKCYPTTAARPPHALDRPGAHIVLVGL